LMKRKKTIANLDQAIGKTTTSPSGRRIRSMAIAPRFFSCDKQTLCMCVLHLRVSEVCVWSS
jgi:hypothetical protein